MRCNYIKFNNKQCLASAMKNSRFCFIHNPETKKERREAILRGGRMSKKNRSRLPPVIINKPKDVVVLLATTINEVRSGLIELKIANCLGYLSGHLIKAMEVSDLGERVSKIEETLNKNFKSF
ncbi:MAG: hypothetical protein WCW16_02140 [Candidatus Magasanikbacteria bacterium]